MLVQVLDIERDEKSELHCEREIDEYFNNTVIKDNNLPDVVVEEYNNDKITYLGVTTNTYGDGTRITNVDKVYEIIIGNNPIIYDGIMNDIELLGYYDNNINKLSVDKNDLYYKIYTHITSFITYDSKTIHLYYLLKHKTTS